MLKMNFRKTGSAKFEFPTFSPPGIIWLFYYVFNLVYVLWFGLVWFDHLIAIIPLAIENE